MTEEMRSFEHYVGIEEENVIISIANLGRYYAYIHELDKLYKNLTAIGPVDNPELKIPIFLYLYSHSEFCFAMASFLRLHKSKSFCSLRSSIDSAFTAYYLIKHPEKIDIYLSGVNQERDPQWNSIFLNIKRTIKNSIDDYPLAKGLTDVHEFCSIYAHSDALGIIHRYNVDTEKSRIETKYFDYEEDVDDYKKWLSRLLLGFYSILVIYWGALFKNVAGDKCEHNARMITTYGRELDHFLQEYPLQEISS